MAAYLSQIDAEILSDKKSRRGSGLTVERRNEPRTLITKYGDMTYERTYYKNVNEKIYRTITILLGQNTKKANKVPIKITDFMRQEPEIKPFASKAVIKAKEIKTASQQKCQQKTVTMLTSTDEIRLFDCFDRVV